jgi:Ubiquitin family
MNVFIRNPYGRSAVKVDAYSTIGSICQFGLYANGNYLPPESNFTQVTDNQMLYSANQLKGGEGIKIIIRQMTGATTNVMIPETPITILDIKNKIMAQLSIPSSRQHLYKDGVLLQDTSSTKDYSIEEGSIIHLIKDVSTIEPSPESTHSEEAKIPFVVSINSMGNKFAVELPAKDETSVADVKKIIAKKVELRNPKLPCTLMGKY